MNPDTTFTDPVASADAEGQQEDRIMSLRKCGMTFKAIGDALGLTPSRARHLYLRGCGRVAGRKPAWTDGLNQRLAKSLRWLEFSNREEVAEALKSGHLQRLAACERTLSAAALAELAQWVEKDERRHANAADQARPR